MSPGSGDAQDQDRFALRSSRAVLGAPDDSFRSAPSPEKIATQQVCINLPEGYVAASLESAVDLSKLPARASGDIRLILQNLPAQLGMQPFQGPDYRPVEWESGWSSHTFRPLSGGGRFPSSNTASSFSVS